MKKLFLVLIPLLFLFVSCDTVVWRGNYRNEWEYEIYNKSSYDLIIEVDDINYTLNIGENVYLLKKSGSEINVLNNERVIYTKDRELNKPYQVVFSDMTKYSLVLFNPTNYDVIIYEENGLLGETSEYNVTVPSNETVTCDLYTLKPKLKAKYVVNNLSCDIKNISWTVTY